MPEVEKDTKIEFLTPGKDPFSFSRGSGKTLAERQKDQLDNLPIRIAPDEVNVDKPGPAKIKKLKKLFERPTIGHVGRGGRGRGTGGAKGRGRKRKQESSSDSDKDESGKDTNDDNEEEIRPITKKPRKQLFINEFFPLGKGDQSDWYNLRENKSVTSRPDIRLMKCGLDITRKEEFDSLLVVAVVQMKKDSEVRGMDYLCNRLESTSCDSFNSATSAGSDSGSSRRPRIEEFLSRRVLGQHAGELLLDLHTFVNLTEMTTLSFPGMIVNKTEVILTLLEISCDHLQKLESDTDILLDQRGTIYYSKPFDIMDCEDRSVLIDSLIRLNNFEYQINI